MMMLQEKKKLELEEMNRVLAELGISAETKADTEKQENQSEHQLPSILH